MRDLYTIYNLWLLLTAFSLYKHKKNLKTYNFWFWTTRPDYKLKWLLTKHNETINKNKSRKCPDLIWFYQNLNMMKIFSKWSHAIILPCWVFLLCFSILLEISRLGPVHQDQRTPPPKVCQPQWWQIYPPEIRPKIVLSSLYIPEK